MFGLGVPELILIFVVALIVFGPKRLPEIGRMIGKTLAEFKKATDELKNTVEREVRLDELRQITPSITAPLESVSRTEPAVAAEPAHAAEGSGATPATPIRENPSEI